MRSYPSTSVRDFSRPIVRPGQYPPCGDLSNPGAWSSGGQELSASFPPSYACIAQRGVKSVHHPRKYSGSSSSVVQSEAQSKSPSFRILWGTRLSFSVDDILLSLSSIFDDETLKSIRAKKSVRLRLLNRNVGLLSLPLLSYCLVWKPVGPLLIPGAIGHLGLLLVVLKLIMILSTPLSLMALPLLVLLGFSLWMD